MKKTDRKIAHKMALLAVTMLLITACGNEANTVDNSNVAGTENSKTGILGEVGSGTVKETEEMSAAVEVPGTEDMLGSGDETISGSETDIGKEMENRNEMETTEVSENRQTLETFLKTALLPVGNTMYIWGGGWNEEDTGAGPGATTIGVNSAWDEFARLQDENYNYKDHKYEILNGLDCSGYVGWVVYNLFETEDGKEGYVFKSTETATKYSELGWGEVLDSPQEFLPGDVVSMKGHVWISLGMCEDGSVVLMHASPPGVSICGTPATGKEESQAVALAKTYMDKYYPEWQKKYPDREVGRKYVTEVSVMRWNMETLPDAEKIQDFTAEEVLKLLFAE